MGSQSNILYDESVKKVFRREFSTKLARRSFFNYNPVAIKPPNYPSVEVMLEADRAMEDRAIKARGEVDVFIKDLTMSIISGVGQPLQVDDAVRDLFILYKRYNDELAETINPQFTISKLVRKHLQWKALKLAGAIALFSKHTSITKEDYTYAVTFVEMLDQDMQLFEAELVKEPYEVFVDYMKSTAVEGIATISTHMLRKMGYIPMTGTPTTRMQELVYLATSYDKDGIYSVCDDGICYKEIIRTDIAGVSFVSVTGSKDDRKYQAFAGYDFFETDFVDLSNMLAEDFAYSPFRFKTVKEGAKYDKVKHKTVPEGGVRGKDNILGGCKFLVLDIDNSVITDEQCHLMLEDINHHIARTSNPDNPYKFRVLIELDAIVDISDTQWKSFLESVATELSLKVDLLPKSTIYFSYADRNVLSVTDALPLEVKPHLLVSTEEKNDKPKPTKVQAKAQLEDPLSTFSYAFEADTGTGSRSLIRAAYHAKDLGATVEHIIELMHEINSYWDEPMSTERLEATIISQVRRM